MVLNNDAVPDPENWGLVALKALPSIEDPENYM